MRTIIITEVDDNDYTVVCGDHFQNGLCWDECLGVISTLIISRYRDTRSPAGLRKMESVWETERRVREEIMEQLRPVDRLLIQGR